MRRNWQCFFLITVVLSSFFIAPMPAQGEPLKFNTSTQLLWGDDYLAESQSILVQYLRFSFNPEGKNFSMTGHSRLWQDLIQKEVIVQETLMRLSAGLSIKRVSPFKQIH